MPNDLLYVLHGWTKLQNENRKLGIFADDPDADCLLGFEQDQVERLPIKTYIRRLWLPFQSSKSPVPKCLFNPAAEELSVEIGVWVSDYFQNKDKLTAELEKDRIKDAQTGSTRSAFLEEAAKSLLFDREYGDILWGCRMNSAYPLQNTKREPGDEQPPKWPKDQDLIMLAVRQWMAARLQDRLRRPPVAKKNIPRVECPQDPDQRRCSIAAVIEGVPRDDRTMCGSVEEAVVNGRANTPEASRCANNSLGPKEQPMCQSSTKGSQLLLPPNIVNSTAPQAEASPSLGIPTLTEGLASEQDVTIYTNRAHSTSDDHGDGGKKTSNTWYCTFCWKPLQSRARWTQHERDVHYPMYKWRCVYCPTNTFLKSSFGYNRHFKKVHYKFHSKSKIMGQKEEMHDKEERWRCGFCNDDLNSWAMRRSHIAQHYIYGEGLTKDRWKLNI